MKLPNDLKYEQIMNDDQVMYRNPSHFFEAEGASDQAAIVKKLQAENRDTGEVVFEYTEASKPWKFPGFTKIRELNPDDIAGMLKTLMKFKINIIQVHIRLGHYPKAKQLRSAKLSACAAGEPRHPTDTAKVLADVLADRTHRVVELKYVVDSATPGQYRAYAEALYVETDEEYNDNECFNPAIGIRYFVNQ